MLNLSSVDADCRLFDYYQIFQNEFGFEWWRQTFAFEYVVKFVVTLTNLQKLTKFVQKINSKQRKNELTTLCWALDTECTVSILISFSGACTKLFKICCNSQPKNLKKYSKKKMKRWIKVRTCGKFSYLNETSSFDPCALTHLPNMIIIVRLNKSFSVFFVCVFFYRCLFSTFHQFKVNHGICSHIHTSFE